MCFSILQQQGWVSTTNTRDNKLFVRFRLIKDSGIHPWFGTSRTLDCHTSGGQLFDSGGVVHSTTSLEELEVSPKAKHEGNLVVAILGGMSKKSADKLEMSYNLGVQPSSVCALDDGVVEIILVAFVLILELMEEVEDVESESCRRTVDRRWKPTGAEELDIFGSEGIATTVTDNEAVNARQVEYHEVVGRGGSGTRVTTMMSKLDDKADGREGRVFEVPAIPFLRHVSADDLL